MAKSVHFSRTLGMLRVLEYYSTRVVIFETFRNPVIIYTSGRRPQSFAQGGHFQDHMKFSDFPLTFPVAWTGKDYQYNA